MERLRKPFQGVTNIIRFNWHFYLLAALLVLALAGARFVLANNLLLYIYILIVLIAATTIISLLVSFYVYDLSDLYTLNWLDKINLPQAQKIANIHAGFDETSALLRSRYPDEQLAVFDFYNPEKHTEISIQRARNAYPPYPGTQVISTSGLPVADNAIDVAFLIFAAHEVRNDAERTAFFKELSRVLQPNGKIVVTEHLRDAANFLAYNVGFFHFHSKATWKKTFASAGLKISGKLKINPFITVFTLEKNGTTA